MAKVALNKASLNRERGSLKTFKRFLPSLELKRQQLKQEESKALKELAQVRTNIDELTRMVGEIMPMIGSKGVEVSGLIRLTRFTTRLENVVGVKLPVTDKVETTHTPYSLITKPHWVDSLIRRLEEMILLRVRLSVHKRRVELLEKAVIKVTQRVNLFEKVLIPTAETNIKKIKIYLSDYERAAVVRSKIAKRMHERQEALARAQAEVDQRQQRETG